MTTPGEMDGGASGADLRETAAAVDAAETKSNSGELTPEVNSESNAAQEAERDSDPDVEMIPSAGV